MVLLGSGHSRTSTRKLTAFAAGAVLAGGATYALLGLIGQLVPLTGEGVLRWTLVAGGVAAAGWYIRPRWLPSTGRQVNRSLAVSGHFGAGMYGAILGCGWMTIVVTPFVWLGLIATIAAGSTAWGVVYGLAFALGRVSLLLFQYLFGPHANDVRTVTSTLGRVGSLRWLGLFGAIAVAVLSLGS